MANVEEQSVLDLVGGPFAVIESDPAVFTTLMRKLGVRGLEVTEIYDIEPWATDHLNPRGLIFCYPCNDEDEDAQTTASVRGDDGVQDPDAEDVWFAYQLSSDACASQTVLNVVLNLEHVELDGSLRYFSADTANMDPMMRGLAITNCAWIREAHNSVSRPADIRGARHAVAKSAHEYAKKQKAAARLEAIGPPSKRRRTTSSHQSRGKQASTDNMQDSYHFIGYVPRGGRVWELDSLRQGGPLEVGELVDWQGSSVGGSHKGWMDVVRPAIKRRMQNLKSVGGDTISFNLLAIVDDKYEKASDELEMLKRERIQLERRLNEEYPDGWSEKVDKDLFASGPSILQTSVQSHAPGPTFARDFASRKLAQDMIILDMPRRSLVSRWESCMTAAMSAKVVVEEELATAASAHTENIKRTFDYEPFIRAFVTQMHNADLLEPILTGMGPQEPASKPSRKKQAT